MALESAAEAELASLIDALIDPHEPPLRLPSPASSDSSAPTAPPSPPRLALHAGAKRSLYDAELPEAVDEESRVARRKARNRRAAADSRERKKAAQDGMALEMEALRAENAELRRLLAATYAPTDIDTDTTTTTDRSTRRAAAETDQWPIFQQPAAFWTPSPQLEASQPPVASAAAIRLVLSLAVFCRLKDSISTSTAMTTPRTLFSPTSSASTPTPSPRSSPRSAARSRRLPRVKRWTRSCVRSVACAA